jgi:hypothetical protein
MLILVITVRLTHASAAAMKGDLEPFVAFGFSVIFPATLYILLLRLPAMQSAEGVLMRIATFMQLGLIILFPSWSLLLLLGLPVAFLCVEIFETRAPKMLRLAVRRALVAKC